MKRLTFAEYMKDREAWHGPNPGPVERVFDWLDWFVTHGMWISPRWWKQDEEK